MSLDKLPVNIFDVIVLAVLAAGVWRGRKHGMSEELLMALKWLSIMLGCAFAYEPLGRLIAQEGNFSLLSSYLMAYISVALVILILFAGVKRGLGGKLLGSDLFGKAEYYLGMGAGLARFTCMLLVAMALLNARFFSDTEIKAMERFQNDVYGSNFFPGLHSLQATVFERSFLGSAIRENLGFLLIKQTAPEEKKFKQKEYQFP
jgi:uncharacterized membrane protein required for colicin V production